MRYIQLYYITILSLIGFLLYSGYVYAYLEKYIPWDQFSSGDSSYQGQKIHTISGSLLLRDTWQDDIMSWDTLQGDYFDSMFGFFQTNPANNGVEVSTNPTSKCTDNSTHDGYKLNGYSYNANFGFVNFNFDASNYVYICVPNLLADSSVQWYFGWNAYSPYIWFQNFDGIYFDGVIPAQWITGSGILITGNTSWRNIAQQDSIRLIGKIEKATLRRDILQKVYSKIRNVVLNNGTRTVSSLELASSLWSWDNGTVIWWGQGLYFWWWDEDNITILWTTSLIWNKTLVVEWKNVYISWNIRWDGMLWIIVLQNEWKWGNIYIDPSVTDIHASMYADKSVLSYSSIDGEYNGDTLNEKLKNQLYIKGSIFSENTIWGAVDTVCPYYVEGGLCNETISKKYDLNYTRRYELMWDLAADGTPTWWFSPRFWWLESYMWGTVRWSSIGEYRKHSMVIDYNPEIQKSPPLFFD